MATTTSWSPQYYLTNGQTDEGRAYLFLGSPTGPGTTPDWTAEGNQAGARFGWSIFSAGDVNGDGYDDIAVSADLYDHTYTNEGAAFVYLGLASGPSPTPAWSAYGEQSGVRYGHSVATVGDVNGDGFDDFSVSSIWYSNGESSEGRAFIYAGSASGLPATATWTFEPNQAGAQVNLVRGAGDVNGDGSTMSSSAPTITTTARPTRKSLPAARLRRRAQYHARLDSRG